MAKHDTAWHGMVLIRGLFDKLGLCSCFIVLLDASPLPLDAEVGSTPNTSALSFSIDCYRPCFVFSGSDIKNHICASLFSFFFRSPLLPPPVKFFRLRSRSLPPKKRSAVQPRSLVVFTTSQHTVNITYKLHYESGSTIDYPAGP